MNIVEKQLGELQDQPVYSYTLTNHQGMSVTCLNYGCIITDIQTPDREGRIESVVLGFDEWEDYLKWSPYFGAVVGRVAGRIKNAQFELDGNVHYIEKNEGENHLHGGHQGFSHKIWATNPFKEKDEIGIRFAYTSPDGEAGYPGNLYMEVEYRLNDENEFIISYKGTSDKKTIVNLTNHSYFNLHGKLKKDISNHRLFLNSDRFLALNEQLLSTGEIIDVSETVFDFQNGRMINEGFTRGNPQNVIVGYGYDHPFIFKENEEKKAILFCEESGRKLAIETDQPGVILYTSNQLEGDYLIRGVKPCRYLGVCLETQRLHQLDLPSIILDRDQEYRAKTKYKFSVVNSLNGDN
ncbi:aldose epimerase family protein [Heyndrickxia sp. NPDC080065]|uniref:aldose epimerase family protein n=1 Tax=Heyndrickxia sp. NPDC080065 TaxID=3390568 RepID=UPI003CFCA1E7